MKGPIILWITSYLGSSTLQKVFEISQCKKVVMTRPIARPQCKVLNA